MVHSNQRASKGMLWALVLLFLAVVVSHAKTVSNQYSFTYKGLSTSFMRGNSVVKVAGLSTHGEPGYPDLPVKRIKIVLPQGYDLDSVEIVGSAKKVTENVTIVPAQGAIPISAPKRVLQIERNASIYASDALYPEKLCINQEVFTMRGYRILSANLYPVRYNPASGELFFYENLEVRVHLKPAARAVENLFRGFSDDAAAVASFVDNPEGVRSYASRSRSRTDLDGIIVTNSTMKSAYDELATWKKSLGLEIEVVLMSQILSSATGADSAEKLRNYIIKMYKERGISYVTLGGDIAVVPYRILYNNSTLDDYHKRFPCDLYFSGLDGNWNANNDEYYGEFHKDSSDYYGEVFVGRLSTETASEAQAVVKKIKKFESTPRSKTVFLQASMMDDTNSSRDVKEGNEYTDSVGCSYYVPDGYTVKTLYQEDGKNTNQAYINGWEGGALMLNHCGHGLERSYSICRRGDHFGNSDASALVNDVYPIHATISCLTGSFDWETDDCIAEKLLLNPNGGVVSTVQNSRNGLYSYGNALKHSGELDIELYRQLFEQRVPSLGQAVQFARQEFATLAWYNSAYNQVVYVWNLIGDPTLRVLDDEPLRSLKIISPDKEDTAGCGREYKVRWESKGEGSQDWKMSLFYATGYIKDKWVEICSDETNDGLCAWQVPDSAIGRYRLKLVAMKGETEVISAVTREFHIKSGVGTAPVTSSAATHFGVTGVGNSIEVRLQEGVQALVRLMDIRGRQLDEKAVLSGGLLRFGQLSRGVYVLSVKEGEKVVSTKVTLP